VSIAGCGVRPEGSVARARVEPVAYMREAGDTDERVNSNTRTRPACEIAGTLATPISVAQTVEPGAVAGVCGVVEWPSNVGRSHVGNGAVHGASTRTISEHAANLESIALESCGVESKGRATAGHRGEMRPPAVLPGKTAR
jgi:hypothetical protein